MEKIKNICNIISSGLDAKTVIGFIENESENCYIFSVANEWLQNLITNILSLFKEKILII